MCETHSMITRHPSCETKNNNSSHSCNENQMMQTSQNTLRKPYWASESHKACKQIASTSQTEMKPKDILRVLNRMKPSEKSQKENESSQL